MARETTAPAGGGFRPVHHPAGLDDALRIAVEEVWAGRWMAMRDLLERTGADWALRTARTQVLGAVAAGSTIVEAWAAEEGHSVDARVMWARVVVQRAQRAHRQRHPEAVHLEHQAREACRLAVEAAPGDPVPWICLLTLASLDERQERPEHQLQPWEIMLPPGPWGLLSRIWERDQCNREAFHRMLQFFQACTTGAAASVSAVDFARWVASWAPAGSALLALPLFAYADLHRRQAADPRGQGRSDALLRSQWSVDPIRSETLRAYRGWFATRGHGGPAPLSVADLSHLAFAMWSARHYAEAAEVFAAMGAHTAVQPWASFTADPSRPDLATEEFLRARRHCMGA
ncbi:MULTISPECIES: hypothetical protein [Streptomyces]|uniref:hypothetical protein n=1 Tax=Streptomyces TaxID=1883 RepID=UPI00163D2F08|nr:MULTISPECIES: hypothetical protein [Streptomyces]MBC2878301.1 hypothetical protein [Streptomyces sp. TYQ1024]UBI40583.1 hypothetical protein K7I03_31720 [Streptomyces mobaraensis]UKW33164.1 hypothetical protein MCU78_31640 [Streptomyces sp. TYQ1024]